MKFLYFIVFLISTNVLSAQVVWDISYTQKGKYLYIQFKGQPAPNAQAICVYQSWLEYQANEKEQDAAWHSTFEAHFPTSYPKKSGIQKVHALKQTAIHLDQHKPEDSYIILEQVLELKEASEPYKARCVMTYDDLAQDTDQCGYYISTMQCFKIASSAGQLVSKTACKYLQKSNN